MGYILLFWLVVAAVAYPFIVDWVKRKPPIYQPDMNCVNPDNWMFFSKHGGVGSWKIGGNGNLKVTIEKKGRDHFDIGLSNPLEVAFLKNDRLRIVVRARCSNPSKVTLVLHRAPGGEDPFWKESIPVGPTWSEFRLEFPAVPTRKGDGFLSIYLGSRAGAYEFGSVTLVKRGTPPMAPAGGPG